VQGVGQITLMTPFFPTPDGPRGIGHQLRSVRTWGRRLAGARSLAIGGHALARRAHFDWVRPGIIL